MEREIIELTEFEIAQILCEKFFDENDNIIGNPIWDEFEIIASGVDYYDIDKGDEERFPVVRR